MSTLEIVLLVVVLGFALYGAMLGLLQGIGSIIGLFVGYAVATHYVNGIAHFLTPLFGGNKIAAVITGFTILFVLASKLVGLLFYFLDKIFKLVAIFPGLKLLDSIGGFVLGLLEGIVIVGISLNILTHVPVPGGTATAVEQSSMLKFFRATSHVVTGFYPDAQSSIQNVLQ